MRECGVTQAEKFDTVFGALEQWHELGKFRQVFGSRCNGVVVELDHVVPLADAALGGIHRDPIVR